MPRMSQLEYEAFLARGASHVDPGIPSTGADTESPLHDAIMDYCRARSWFFLHGAMSERTHRTLGEPDFLIFRPGGNVLLVECKSRTNKLSPAQAAVKCQLEMNGHTVHIVRSMEEFKAL